LNLILENIKLSKLHIFYKYIKIKRDCHQGATKDEVSTFTAAVKLSVEGSWIGTILYIVPWNPTT
jgi:hypothetical protein